MNNFKIEHDSLKKRYLFKLATNIIGFFISISTQAIIPRGLGPRAYGDFNFLTNFFVQMTSFLEMGTSTCFFTKLSMRPKDEGLVSFYIRIIAVLSLIVLTFVIIMQIGSAHQWLWPQQNVEYIYMAAIYGVLTWVVMVLSQMTDAYGLTVPAEKIKIVQKILGLMIVMVLYWLQTLHLFEFYVYNYIILMFLGLLLIWLISKSANIMNILRQKVSGIKQYAKEFYSYCHPLLLYALVGFVANILDRWLLQVFGGSVQQGYFSLSYNIGAVCFLFTGAMTPLLMREFAIAYQEKNLEKMASDFKKYIPPFVSMAAFVSCYVAVQADKIVAIFGGEKFNEAILPVFIMSFYPIFQTSGQLCGSVFLSTGRTDLYRNMGIIFLLIGIPITFFLVAPHDIYGINAGATGLAVKSVLIQVFGVYAMIYFATRILKIHFWEYIIQQGMSIVVLLSIAVLSTWIVDFALSARVNSFVSFFVAGILYSSITIVIVYTFASIFGTTRQELQRFWQDGLNKIGFGEGLNRG